MAVYEINTLKSDTVESTDTVAFRYCHYNVLNVIFYCKLCTCKRLLKNWVVDGSDGGGRSCESFGGDGGSDNE